MNVRFGAGTLQKIRDNMMLLVRRDAKATDFNKVRRIVRPTSIDVGTTVDEVFDHFKLPTMGSFPEHCSAVRSNMLVPVRPLLQNRFDCFQVTSPSSADGDLQEVANVPG